MKKIYITTVLMLLIIVVINLLSNEFHLRLDLTADNQYTLSDATVEILENLDEPITIKAYFSSNMPPSIAKTKQDFQEMLVEYAALSDGMLQYEFIDPGVNEAKENEAMQAGVQPMMINVREKDQVKQQRAFMGAVISLGSKQEVLAVIPPNSPIEYNLSSSLKKISVDKKTDVGFLQGHGEATVSEMPQLREQLDVLYNPIPVDLSDSVGIPSTLKTLVIVRPMDSIPPQHIQMLDDFLSKGGHIAIAMNRVDGNLQAARGIDLPTGLEGWLASKGIVVEPNFIIDAKCASVTMQQQTPFGMMQSQLPFPYLPVVGKFADHPATKGLEAVVLQFASQIRYVGDSTRRFTPLLYSSDRANVELAPVMFDFNKQWTEADLPLSELVIGASIEGKLAGESQSKLIVIADGDFPVNGSGQQQSRIQPDNVNLMSNIIDWLSDDTGLIDLRTKGATSHPIDEMEPATKAIIKYSNFALPILLVVGYGFVRFQRNRMKRLKRMSENYEED